MEAIRQAITKALPNGPHALPEKATNATQPEPPPQVRITAMRRFWQRMAAIYGHRWTSAYGERCDDDSGVLTVPGDTWQRGLSGVGERSIGTGLNACVISADPWPPTLPAFRAMCFAVPSFPAVLIAMRGKSAQTPFSRLTAQFLDSYRLRQVDADKAERMIRDAYELAREHVMSGGDLPGEPAGAIEAPKEPQHRPADPETAKQHLDYIAELLHVTPEQQA